LALVETSWPVRVPPAVGSFLESATTMFAEPLNATPLIVLEVWSVVAVVVFPASAPEKFAAVRVPAPLRVAKIAAPAPANATATAVEPVVQAID
jgi:hypothetical protein